MSKVYIVSVESAWAYEPVDTDIVGVYADEGQAKEIFDKVVAENKRIDKENGYDMAEEDVRIYNAWKDGEYNTYHTLVMLTEHEVKTDRVKNKQFQIRYVVQESVDGILWRDVADCASEEEAVAEVVELQDNELKRRAK